MKNATGNPRCAVASLQELLERVPLPLPLSDHFNNCSEEAHASPRSMIFLYAAKPCKRHQFSFMPDISRNSGCSRNYTLTVSKLPQYRH